jgi:hypothetical protein
MQLAPHLSAGDIVVMDNVSVHRVVGVVQGITAQGGTIRSMPPYAPNMNPIELAFAKFKAMPRRAAARSICNLWRRIADIVRNLLPQGAETILRTIDMCASDWDSLWRGAVSHRVSISVGWGCLGRIGGYAIEWHTRAQQQEKQET